MGYAEFVEWLAFYQVEPFGGLRGDLHAALGASLTANVNRDAKKHPTPFKPGEFMPDFWDERGPTQAADLLTKFRLLTEGYRDGDTDR